MRAGMASSWWNGRFLCRPGHYPFAPLEVTSHHVDVKIDGQVAVTSIDQEFYNPNDQRLEGTYMFPVPKGAHIDKFCMEIGGKMMDAELLPADKARQIYEDIVRKMRDPALLEYAGRDLFKVRIFPIEPHSRKPIKISYTELLRSDTGAVTYMLSVEHGKIFRAADQRLEREGGSENSATARFDLFAKSQGRNQTRWR